LRGAVITQPVELDTSSRLPGASERSRAGFCRFRHPVGLDQKQFALSEPEEGLATLRIGASAEHFLTAFCPARSYLSEPLDSESPARPMPPGFPGAQYGFANPEIVMIVALSVAD
jgi:hypothetical protein